MLDDIDRKIIIEMSKDIELCSSPYENISKKLNITMENILKRISDMIDKGYIKRIAPVIKHTKTEYIFNGLSAFNVEEDEKEKLTLLLKNIENISHVYERKTNEKWTYSVYGMIHGTSKDQVEKTVNKIINSVELNDYKVMYTIRELKKTSPNIEYLLKNNI